MPREIDSTLAADVAKPVISPCILVILAFVTATRYVWSGVGPVTWGGNTYLGVGSLGTIGGIGEGAGSSVNADGTSLTLSGIDPIYLAESMADIQIGSLAEIYFGTVAMGTGNTLVGTPYKLYRGTVDQPSIDMGGETVSITIALENRMIDLQRPRMQRYTASDQQLRYPTDSGYNWVEVLNDAALKEGI